MIKHLLIKKAASKRGFSLSELLIVLLIMTITSMAIAIGISSAARAYRNVRAAAESSILCGTLAAELSDTLRYATDISSGSGSAVFTHRRFGQGVSVETVSTGTNPVKKRVYVGGQEVVSDSAYTELHAGASVTYNGSYFTLVIKVYDFDGKTELRSLNLTVAPLSA